MALIYATMGGLSMESIANGQPVFHRIARASNQNPRATSFGYAMERTTPPSTRREAPQIAAQLAIMRIENCCDEILCILKPEAEKVSFSLYGLLR